MTIPKDPFANLILDEEEQAIEDALENDEYISNPDFEESKEIAQAAAKRYLDLQK